jgi:hypothetical protein
MRPIVELPPAQDYALKIRHTYQSGWEQWYLLTGDCHWDSPECYLKLLHRHLKEARERNALWIDNGDFFEAISAAGDGRGSKGTLEKEHCGVNYLDRLVDDAVEEFRPYLDMLTYMGTGNHDMSITIKRETDILQRFVDAANRERGADLPPIHHAGYTGWIRFHFTLPNDSSRLSHAMKLEHGTGGNSPVTKGTIQANRRSARTEGATFFVSSHIHEQWALSGPVETLNGCTGRVEVRNVKHIQLGSYRQDFRTDGVGTWIMQRSGSPKPVGGTWLRFFSPNGNDLRWEVRETWVDYPNLHGYLRHAQPEPIGIPA